MRIMFNANPPFVNSGYAGQLGDLLPRLKKNGHMVAVNAFYGVEGGIAEINGIPHYPKLASTWGDDGMIFNARDFNADTVISLQDVWVLNIEQLKQVKNWIAYVPIDHDPVPPAVFERLRAAYRVITYSRFGQDQLMQKGMHSTYIPHTVDTKVFTPHNKIDVRKKAGIPLDHFVFGMVAANKDNPPRKSFQEAMDAFKLFHDKHENSTLFMHVLVDNPSGFPIKQYAKFLGIDKNVMYTPPYEIQFKLTKSDMARIYSSFDCLLAPSTNEGFGVPIIEAQSCAVPVITSNWTSMPELIINGETGFTVEALHKRFTALLSYSYVPDPKSIYERMEEMYNADRVAMGKKGREHIMQYDTDTVVKQHWLPFLAKLEEEFKIDQGISHK